MSEHRQSQWVVWSAESIDHSRLIIPSVESIDCTISWVNGSNPRLSLIYCDDTLWWYTVMIHCDDALLWYTTMIHCDDTLCWHTVMILWWYTVMIRCDDALLQRTKTPSRKMLVRSLPSACYCLRVRTSQQKRCSHWAYHYYRWW
jgi:hypothetical protein